MFTDKQIEELSAPLQRSHIKTRSQAGRQLSYVEGWHAIAEANRIFGFDGWTRDTVEMRCVSEREREIGQAKRPGWAVTYVAKVRVAVQGPNDDGGCVWRDGYGSGHGIDVDLGQAHESALKEAETDAMKRALMTFGNPFGLALYDKEQNGVADDPPPASLGESKRIWIAAAEATIDAAYDPDALAAWWRSDEQSKQRRDFLDQSDTDALKRKLITMVEALKKAKEPA